MAYIYAWQGKANENGAWTDLTPRIPVYPQTLYGFTQELYFDWTQPGPGKLWVPDT
ncbi:MAG TPA: hypothetical protein VFJ30_00570 [Phycisphaerae bacterium]|nr:hypothetical protein [Phycisphaerae bacterium]